MISIVVPTRPNIDNIHNLIRSFNKQSYKQFTIIIIIDKELTQSEFNTIKDDLLTITDKKKISLKMFSNINSDFIPQQNASATRNYGILQSDTTFTLLLDDDIIVDEEYLQLNINLYNRHMNHIKKDFLLTGNLIYRDTHIIQNQGFKDYNYRFSRPQVNLLKDKIRDSIRMYGGCGIFGKTSILREFQFDENIDFIIEDIDFTYRITKKYPMVVDRNIAIHHMDREKSILENTQVGNEFSAYRKGKHRITFVKKNASLVQKMIFFCIGLHLSNIRLSVKILNFGGKQRWSILKSFWKGTWEGLREKVKKNSAAS